MLWPHNAVLLHLLFLLPMLLTFNKEKKILKEDIPFSPESFCAYSPFLEFLVAIGNLETQAARNTLMYR